MRRSCCGSRPRGVPDEFRIGREIRGLAERARTADDEYKEHLTTVNIGTVGTFSVTVRNTASGLSPTASPSLRVLPRRRRPSRASVPPRIRPSPANHLRSPLAGTNFDQRHTVRQLYCSVQVSSKPIGVAPRRRAMMSSWLFGALTAKPVRRAAVRLFSHPALTAGCCGIS